jgi:hypothetical protein
MASTRKRNRRKPCRRKTCKRGGWLNKIGIGFKGLNIFSKETGSYKGDIEQDCYRVLGLPRICRNKQD